MAQLFVKPGVDRRPRHEATHKQLHEDGEYWTDTPYLRRLLKNEDVHEATDPAALPPKPVLPAESEVLAQPRSGTESPLDPTPTSDSTLPSTETGADIDAPGGNAVASPTTATPKKSRNQKGTVKS